MKKIILAYSGGLDTSYCLKKLSTKNEVHAVNINTGGYTIEETNKIKEKAIRLGAYSFTSIDAVDSFYNRIIKYLVYGNVLRNNTYPLSVSSERTIQAMEIVNYAKQNNATHIAHGSTGAGNDQVRFDSIFQILAPEIKILTPIRDSKLTRENEIDFLNQSGIKISWEKAKYSINKGLWGTSVGGDETLTSDLKLPNSAYPGNLKSKTSKEITCIELISKQCNDYCIGRDTHVGDSIIGIKGRVGFQAGGPMLIIKSHHLLEKHTLTKWQQFQKDQLSNFYGMHLHEGQYLDPVLRDIECFLQSSQKNVNGDVYVTLHPFRFELNGIKSKNDLMNNVFGTYGEINNKWSAEDAKGFIKIVSNQNKIHQYVNSK